MKVSELISELEHIKAERGDINVEIQNTFPQPCEVTMETGEKVMVTCVSDSSVFAVAEEYETGFVCNLRSWPY